MLAKLAAFVAVLAGSWVWAAVGGGWRRVEEAWLGLRARSLWSRAAATRVRRWEEQAIRPWILAAEGLAGLLALALLPHGMAAAGVAAALVLQLVCRAGRFSRFFEERARQQALELHLAVYELLRGLSSTFYANVKSAAEAAYRREQTALEAQLDCLAAEYAQLERGKTEAARQVTALRQAFTALREESVCGRCLLSSHTQAARRSSRSYSDRDYNAKKHVTLSTGPSPTASAVPLHFSVPCHRGCLRRVLRVWSRRFLKCTDRTALPGRVGGAASALV